MPKIEIGWSLDKEDMPVVRHVIKAYKKRTNRKPENWYVKKKTGQKKDELNKYIIKVMPTRAKQIAYVHP